MKLTPASFSPSTTARVVSSCTIPPPSSISGAPLQRVAAARRCGAPERRRAPGLVSLVFHEPVGRDLAAEAPGQAGLVDAAGDRVELGPLEVASFRVRDLACRGAAGLR